MRRAFASIGIRSEDVPMHRRIAFIEKIDYAGPGRCWEWTASKTSQGYGRFMLRPFGCTTAQRVAYAIFIGDLRPGLTVDHLCGNPGCVKPEHLQAVPHRMNILRGERGAAAVNARKTHCRFGHELVQYIGPNSRQRYCPICKRQRGREWQRRRRGSLPERFRV